MLGAMNIGFEDETVVLTMFTMVSMLNTTQTQLATTQAYKLTGKSLWKHVFGREGKTKHAVDIANDHIDSGKPTNAKIINQILGTNITDNVLQELVNSAQLKFANITDTSAVIKAIIKQAKSRGILVGRYGISGIYIWTHLPTGKQYVGSSIQLPIRLRSYFAHSMRVNGKFLTLFYSLPLSEFSLDVIVVKSGERYEQILEQYYLLGPLSTLNTIRVSNNPSGSTQKPLYMYNRDYSIMYFFSLKQTDFINHLNVNHTTFNKHLTNGTYYLNKYVFSREFVKHAVLIDLSLTDLKNMLKVDRSLLKKNKPVAPHRVSVEVQHFKNNEKVQFDSLGKCIKYLKSLGFKPQQRTLNKRLDTGEAYYGFVCKRITNS